MAESSDEREESEDERLDRELMELLQELRVALPGVQVLLAFLLVAPLNQRFPELESSGRLGYLIALIGAVLATILLIAPSAYHRLRFRQGEKEQLLRRSTAMMLAGLFFMAVAINMALFVIVEFLWGTGWGLGLALSTGTLTLLVWYVLPFVTGRRAERRVADAE